MRMKHWLVLIGLFFALPLWAGTQGELRKGGKLYAAKKYGQAFAHYNDILKTSPQQEQAAFGLGASAYYLKDYQAAAQAFEQVSTQNGLRAQDALFNLGNTYYRAGQQKKAVQAYRQAILANPNDKEAIHNLQLILQEENSQKQNNQDQQNNQNEQSSSPNQQTGDQNNPAGGSKEKNDSSSKTPAPQEDAQRQAEKEMAEQVIRMAKENEHKPNRQAQPAPLVSVEKDW